MISKVRCYFVIYCLLKSKEARQQRKLWSEFYIILASPRVKLLQLLSYLKENACFLVAFKFVC